MERIGVDPAGPATRGADLRALGRPTGVPKGAAGDDILLTSRLVDLADVVEVFHRAGGVDAAVAVARAERAGTQFDPQLVDAFAGQAASVLAGSDGATRWDAVIGAEPGAGGLAHARGASTPRSRPSPTSST